MRIRADPEQADHSSTVLQDLVQRDCPVNTSQDLPHWHDYQNLKANTSTQK